MFIKWEEKDDQKRHQKPKTASCVYPQSSGWQALCSALPTSILPVSVPLLVSISLLSLCSFQGKYLKSPQTSQFPSLIPQLQVTCYTLCDIQRMLHWPRAQRLCPISSPCGPCCLGWDHPVLSQLPDFSPQGLGRDKRGQKLGVRDEKTPQ